VFICVHLWRKTLSVWAAMNFELKGRQSQGSTLQEAIPNIKVAIELYRDAPHRPGSSSEP
jgi:predicted RNase H-like HicB family nuclease